MGKGAAEMSTPTFDTWLKGLINKRPAEVLRLLSILCERGLARGSVTANDVDRHALGVAKNSVGASFKVLKRLGFVRSSMIAASNKAGRNSSLILVWELRDGGKAQRFLGECRGLLLRQENKEVTAEQMHLL